jgi:hypothetical protein
MCAIVIQLYESQSIARRYVEVRVIDAWTVETADQAAAAVAKDYGPGRFARRLDGEPLIAELTKQFREQAIRPRRAAGRHEEF